MTDRDPTYEQLRQEHFDRLRKKHFAAGERLKKAEIALTDAALAYSAELQNYRDVNTEVNLPFRPNPPPSEVSKAND